MSINNQTPLADLMRHVPDHAQAKRDYVYLLRSRASMERWAEIARKGLSEATPTRKPGLTLFNDMLRNIGFIAGIVCLWYAPTIDGWTAGLLLCVYMVGLSYGRQ